MFDAGRIRDELLARRCELTAYLESDCIIYGFFITQSGALEPLDISPHGLLYIGMTCPTRGCKPVDHVECTHSGGSALRRSLGALLKGKLKPPLRALPQTARLDPRNWQRYRFQAAGEAALTRWMKAHLQMNVVPLEGSREELRRCEKALIGELHPPLNLIDWPNPQSREIVRLRGICVQEARAKSIAPGGRIGRLPSR